MIDREGEPLQLATTAQRRPIELLQALIATGGRDASADELADAMWPDAEGPEAKRCLDTTLHRLRKLLAVKGAVVMGQSRLCLDRRLIWLDTWAFERALAETTCLASQQTEQLQQTANRILALYRGSLSYRPHTTVGSASAERSSAMSSCERWDGW